MWGKSMDFVFPSKDKTRESKARQSCWCHKGQCIQFSLIIYGSVDGIVLLRSSYAVAFAEGPTPKVPAVARIVQIVLDKKKPQSYP